jgi:hypothetical protein
MPNETSMKRYKLPSQITIQKIFKIHQLNNHISDTNAKSTNEKAKISQSYAAI